MSVTMDTCSVVSSLVPMYSSAGSRTEERVRVNEKQMCAVALLIAETILGTIEAIAQKNYKAFDANPGDGACQNQALELRRIMALDLSEECGELEKAALALKELVQTRKSSHKERGKMTPEGFFETHVESIQISKEMEYLLHCFMLTVTRVPYKTLENGVVLTRTESSRLNKLSKRLSNVSVIANGAQVQLSKLNMEVIRTHAGSLTTVEKKERVTTMLSEEHTHLYTPSARYAPKAHGSLFHSVQTVMHRLREEGALITLKSIVTEREPFHLVMRPSEAGGTFEVLADSAYADLSADAPIVVFEAVVDGSRAEVAEQIRTRGFTDLALTCSSKEAPYEPGSKLSAIKVPEALSEIQGFREKSTRVHFDHVYLTTVKAEGVKDEAA